MRAVRRTMPGMIWSAIAATACATSSPPAVTVDLQPAAAQVLPGGMVEFVATARGAASVGVSWAVVEAQGGVWHGAKNPRQVACRLSNWLSLIHVFDAQTVSEAAPFGRRVHGIGMNDDWPVSGSHPL